MENEKLRAQENPGIYHFPFSICHLSAVQRVLLFAGALMVPALCVAQQATPYQEGIRLLRNEDWAAAAAQLERAVKVEPNRAEAHIALGIARLRSGDVQAGLASFR